jgi:hypothetical protein
MEKEVIHTVRVHIKTDMIDIFHGNIPVTRGVKSGTNRAGT